MQLTVVRRLTRGGQGLSSLVSFMAADEDDDVDIPSLHEHEQLVLVGTVGTVGDKEANIFTFGFLKGLGRNSSIFLNSQVPSLMSKSNSKTKPKLGSRALELLNIRSWTLGGLMIRVT